MYGSGSLAMQMTLLGERVVEVDERVKVCVADDDELVLAGCSHLLADSPKVRLIRSTKIRYSAEEIDWLLGMAPDVLVLGVDKLEAELVEVIAKPRGSNGPAVLLLINELGVGAAEALTTLVPGMQSGFACVYKRAVESSRKLLGLVESVSSGHVSYDAAILSRLFTRNPEGNWVAQLSQRELEVMRLMAKGLSNSAIASTVHVELKTVERHINSIYNKMGAQGSTSHPRVHAVTTFLSVMQASGWPAALAMGA